LYPGIAVAEELVSLRPEAKVVFACSSRPIDRRILSRLDHAVVAQPVRPLPGRIGEVFGFLRAWRSSGKLARDVVADLKPAAVLGLGGFAAAPMVRQAHKAGVPAALLNPDAVPGKANRHLARRADVIFTQFEQTRAHFPAAVRGRIECVGCPVRRSLLTADRQEAMRYFGLRPDRKALLVLGGSLGARSVNASFEALARQLGQFRDTWQALHITGLDKAGLTAGAHEAGAIDIRSVEYCDRMALAYAAADLALCRAGAVTVAELTATGTPAVFMPYPHHADEHQRLNSAPLEQAGAAKICQDEQEPRANARSLLAALRPILREAAVLQAMSQAAIALGRPAAAEAVAEWLAGRPRAKA
jgi:UDP-N-acetylglucosamine--N-acetylmuramyl-(pentapeptide) pyrophosphoryl-undecaprenol N-acetylglucosamine transferase